MNTKKHSGLQFRERCQGENRLYLIATTVGNSRFITGFLPWQGCIIFVSKFRRICERSGCAIAVNDTSAVAAKTAPVTVHPPHTPQLGGSGFNAKQVAVGLILNQLCNKLRAASLRRIFLQYAGPGKTVHGIGLYFLGLGKPDNQRAGRCG